MTHETPPLQSGISPFPGSGERRQRMSVIHGKGFLMTVIDTDVTCPICTFEFDAGEKMGKAKDPVFKMKCPACKSAIGISVPIMGGNTECFEWDAPPHVKRLETVTPLTVNGIPVTGKPFADNSDEADEIPTPNQ